MKKILKKAMALLVCVLALTALLSTAAFAAEGLDVMKNVSLSVRFTYGGEPVKGANFRLYQVALMDENVNFSLTPAFSGYSVKVNGLTQEGWQDLASTLAGYVQRDSDSIAAIAKGTTDASGTIAFSQTFRPGVYLLMGDNVIVEDYVYKSAPSIFVLPERVANEVWLWEYDCTVAPKSDRAPAYESLTRRVLKVWNDKGMENQRPKEITVQLLRDGKEFGTAKLNQANNWRYEWTELSSRYTWTIVEKDVPPGYTVKTEQQGVTCTITNTAQPCEIDPPLKKVISGDKPETDATFRFVMEAVSNTAGFALKDMPMPEGATDGKKIKDVRGGGEYEFGVMRFLREGTYVYKIYEEDTGSAGYTYDKTEYTLTATVTLENGKLKANKAVTAGGKTAGEITFTNKYEKTNTPPKEPNNPKPPQLPQTGQLWWPVPIFAFFGILLLAVGLIRSRGSRHES